MTDESVLDEILSAGDYEIVMCVLFAEVLAGEMPEQYRNLRMEALVRLRGVLAQYQKRMYHDKLLSGIASKKGKMILKATSKAEINRILHPQAPHFDGGKFIPNEYCVTEEELIAWSEASLSRDHCFLWQANVIGSCSGKYFPKRRKHLVSETALHAKKELQTIY